MRKIKNKKQKDNYLIEEGNNYSAKSIIIMVIIMIIVFVSFYFITIKVLENREDQSTVEDNTTVTEEYQSEKILFGQMLTRKENEYYVYAYDQKSKFYDLYEQYLKDYSSKDGALTVYRIDLNDGMNKSYVGDQTSIKDTLEGMQVSDITLFKIKDGKIDKYFTSSNDIAQELKK
jgi:hypothetical protein